MKKITITFALLLVNIFIYSQGQSDYKERLRIANSKVLKSTQWTYKFSQGKVNTKGYITTESKYDEKGNVVEVINYKSNGQISSKLQYKYDKNNNKTEYLKFDKKEDIPDLVLTYKQSFIYDEKGNKKVENGFDGITLYKIIYNTLSDGKIKDVTKYATDNSIIEKWESSYNDNIQTINILKQGKNLDYILIRKLDSKGNILDETRKDAKGKEVKRIATELDANNSIKSYSEYFSGKLSKKLVYKYNSKNQLLEIEQVYPDGSTELNRVFKYDEKGNILEEKWFDGIPNDLSSKNTKYNEKSNPAEVESYYSDYKYKVLYKYTYEYYK